ncbi:hypothetical protein [Lonepinella sp. BR2357]|uniref:hypothetical protein n=1 Tax=Lonepinella sp. BR2357 TaxID=3434549 RepID=UPI003F6DBDEB
MYDVSLKRKWDEYAILTTAKKEGIAQGLQQGRLNTLKENARNMLNRGFDVQLISEILGLPVDEIKKLIN